MDKVFYDGRELKYESEILALQKYGKLTPKRNRLIHPKTWKEDYKEVYNVEHISEYENLPFGDNVIYCTSCSGDKSGEIQYGTPKEIYASKLNQAFYEQMELNEMRYGTLSGHLGLIMNDEKFETYDDGGTSDIYYEEEYMLYADLILEGCKKHGFDTVVFCYSSPLMSEPFIRRLAYTGLKIYYVTKISMINKKQILLNESGDNKPKIKKTREKAKEMAKKSLPEKFEVIPAQNFAERHDNNSEYKLVSEHSFDASHWLHCHNGLCKNLHGHNWRVQIKLKSDKLIEEGTSREMVCDFKDLKKDFRALVDNFDHALIAEKDTISERLLKALAKEGFERIRLVPFRPTCENFAPYFYYEMKAKGYDVEVIKVWETEINSCEYRER